MKSFNAKIQEQFNKMSASGKLFRVKLTGQEVWDLYLMSFSPANNPIFRDPTSSEHNCNHCKNFIRRYGNVVSIDKDYKIVSLFDLENVEEEYADSARELSKAIRASEITEIFIETFDSLNSLGYASGVIRKTDKVFQLGVPSNTKRYTKEEAEKFGVVKPNELRTFNHFNLVLDKKFVETNSGDSVEAIMGRYRDAKQVFQRAMETISLDTLNLVKDLIIQGSLLDGTTHLHKIEKIIPLKKEYDDLAKNQRSNWCWLTSYNFSLAKFRNELIGVLCTDLSEGKELNDACKEWNIRVDPKNYMKASAPITQRQIAEARKFVEDNGYVESFDRRFAVIEDINIGQILHSNVGNGTLKNASIFDTVKSTAIPNRHKKSEFDGVEEVTIENFMKNILPSCTSVEAFLTNAHEHNMVSLTTSKDKNAKQIFKWDNPFSWTFNGNLAGKSQIKEAVKTAGGKVDGVLRFSIMWSGGDNDNSDLDAHCKEPLHHIYYGSKVSPSGGNLDIDITQPLTQMPKGAVENITFPRLSSMRDGLYRFSVHQYSERDSKGFKAEIEFNGEIYSYEYNGKVNHKNEIDVAYVTLKNGQFTIQHKLPEIGVTSKEIYGLSTNNFQKVNLVCLSPNHWGDNNTGNKHYLFMLEGCKSPVSIRSFHIENLLPELATHRKVLEVLGATNMIPSDDNKQLSGLGFNSTVRDELVVRLKGNFQRVVKIKF